MKKYIKKLTASAMAAVMAVGLIASVSASSGTVYIIDDIKMTMTLDVTGTLAYASTSINDSGVLVSVSIDGEYYPSGNKSDTKTVSNGSGGSSYASTNISNGNSVSGYGTWKKVTSTHKAYYWASGATTGGLQYP